jgi:hypothetical protein
MPNCRYLLRDRTRFYSMWTPHVSFRRTRNLATTAAKTAVDVPAAWQTSEAVNLCSQTHQKSGINAWTHPSGSPEVLATPGPLGLARRLSIVVACGRVGKLRAEAKFSEPNDLAAIFQRRKIK